MTPPTILQIGQYLKDMSFENYSINAPGAVQPTLDLTVDVALQALDEARVEGDKTSGNYETILTLRATAKGENLEKPLFVVEIVYAGRYQLADVPTAEVEPFLAIEAPRLLFPFVRQIAADAVMQGGLPPMLLAPVDFAQVYQQQEKERAASF